MKLVGQIIELDPAKKWIAIFDENYFSRESASVALSAMQKGGHGIITQSLESIKFVENSDKIIDMVTENPNESR